MNMGAENLMGKEVVSKAIRLISPTKFELKSLKHELKPGYVVVEPFLASVCHADIRYYTGNRRKEALAEKLPMALLPGGIGRVINATGTSWTIGESGVIIPNIPFYIRENIDKSFCCPSCARGNPDNYCERGVFLGSGFDGIAQSRLVIPQENIVRIPNEIPDEIAVLSELCSVSLHAIDQVKDLEKSDQEIAVFGDGPVGFITAAILHFYYKIPKERLIVFGAIKDKLKNFEFATTYLINDFNFEQKRNISIVFECTGGKFSSSAINQAIDLIEARGKLVLLGVTEEKVPINTRDILEKGIMLFGTSRSGYVDFETLMSILKEKLLQEQLRKLYLNSASEINDVKDLNVVMDYSANNRKWQKINMV